jgi:hypothetical protein
MASSASGLAAPHSAVVAHTGAIEVIPPVFDPQAMMQMILAQQTQNLDRLFGQIDSRITQSEVKVAHQLSDQGTQIADLLARVSIIESNRGAAPVPAVQVRLEAQPAGAASVSSGKGGTDPLHTRDGDPWSKWNAPGKGAPASAASWAGTFAPPPLMGPGPLGRPSPPGLSASSRPPFGSPASSPRGQAPWSSAVSEFIPNRVFFQGWAPFGFDIDHLQHPEDIVVAVWDLIVPLISAPAFSLVKKATAPYFRNYRMTIFLVPDVSRDQVYELCKAVDDAIARIPAGQLLELNPEGRKLMCLPDIEDWKKGRNKAVRVAGNVLNHMGFPDNVLKLDRLSGCVYLLQPKVMLLGRYRRDTDAWIWQTPAQQVLNVSLAQLDVAFTAAHTS